MLWAGNGCAKKAPPKPLHTEPWLAHPAATAAATATGDAAIATTKYVLTDQSRISLELGTRRGRVRGQLTHVTGELEIALGALAQSRGQVRADLASLTLDADGSEEDAAWLARARSALGAVDGGVAMPPTTFELTSVSELSLDALSPGSAKRVRGEAEGNLLLNGFRVAKRLPLEAEFGSTAGEAPASLVIRSRAPLVVTLETHEIHLRDAPSVGAEKHRTHTPSASHDVRVTFELHATKP